MRVRLRSIQYLVLLALPVFVAALGLGVWAALALVALALAWRWAQTLSALRRPPQGPELVLESIAASHFVEKVRWSLDWLGVAYTEEQDLGTLGAFFAGRTVPKLRVRTGIVVSTLGNSADILRYLWARYRAEFGARADFLEPTPDALALEALLDRYGREQQRWIYHHVLPHRRLMLHLWGANDPAVPLWQRGLARVLFPLQRALMRNAFGLHAGSHERTLARIADTLGQMEARLAAGRDTLLGRAPGYADITLAALSGLWLQPENFGAGKSAGIRVAHFDEFPPGMRAEIEAWRADYPRVVAHAERMYRDYRLAAPNPAAAGRDAAEDRSKTTQETAPA